MPLGCNRMRLENVWRGAGALGVIDITAPSSPFYHERKWTCHCSIGWHKKRIKVQQSVCAWAHVFEIQLIAWLDVRALRILRPTLDSPLLPGRVRRWGENRMFMNQFARRVDQQYDVVICRQTG
jgi:hypothetical protein